MLNICEMQMQEIKEHANNAYGITDRECEVWVLIASGFDNNEISKRLFIEPSTVCTHYNNLRRKLEIFAIKKSTQRVKTALLFLVFAGLLPKEVINV